MSAALRLYRPEGARPVAPPAPVNIRVGRHAFELLAWTVEELMKPGAPPPPEDAHVFPCGLMVSARPAPRPRTHAP